MVSGDSIDMKGFPLEGVTVIPVEEVPVPAGPCFTGPGLVVNPGEFRLHVAEVGEFYAASGTLVKYSLAGGADPEWVRLYLNGQVLVALLHQRDIISFHASSFVSGGKGVMILGETGAGKSSLTLSFVKVGAGFLTDDLTPVVFPGGKPSVMPLNRRMKIRTSTAAELGVDPERLTDAESGTGKKYIEITPAGSAGHQVDVILKIEVGDIAEPLFEEPAAAGKFSLLRSEVCSWEILAGMPETEAAYLQQILDIVHQAKVFRVTRPSDIRIADFYESVKAFLGSF